MTAHENAVLRFPEFPRPIAKVSLWQGPDRPDEETLRERLRSDGYQAIRWSGDPGWGYPPHAHIFPELIWVVHGSLTVILPAEGRLLELGPGDRVEIPQGMLHGTLAGPDGAIYLIATR